ncbi:HSP20-like chaperone [Lentinula raphanica]|nr:HSP20-like chaperone [Lentinula raphanica]
MSPAATAKVKTSLSHYKSHPDDDLINQLVLERLKALHKANAIRFVKSRTAPAAEIFKPRCDILEDPSANLVTALFELPGVDQSEVALHLREGFLIIAGERFRPDKRHKKHTNSSHPYTRYAAGSAAAHAASVLNDVDFSKFRYVSGELRYGKFERTIPLPEGIQYAQINARMSEGILIVTWPRQPASQKSNSPKSIYASAK